MAGMVRKQIYIRPDQDRRLKQIAKSLGVSEAELIRQSLDQAVARRATAQQPPPADRSAWEEELAFIRRRQALGPLPGTRDWKREDLYDRPVFRRY